MVMDITALEVSLHNNLESELESDRQKDEAQGKHQTRVSPTQKGFLEKMWNGLETASKKTFSKENLIWSGMVIVASIAASLGAMGIISLLDLSAVAEFANNNVPFIDGMDSQAASNSVKMLGIAAFLPITFGFARAFRDGYGKHDRDAQKYQTREHKKGRGKALEHAQGHGAQKSHTHETQRDRERVDGTVSPIPAITAAMKTDAGTYQPAANQQAANRPAYLKSILDQGASNRTSHVAALEAESIDASSKAIG